MNTRRKLLFRYFRTYRPHINAIFLRVQATQQRRCGQGRAARQLWLWRTTRARALVTYNLASKTNTLSLSTLLRRRHHQRFSTRSLGDISWGKVGSLTEWRNAPELSTSPVYVLYPDRYFEVLLFFKGTEHLGKPGTRTSWINQKNICTTTAGKFSFSIF
jgi:hypothetical protein